MWSCAANTWRHGTMSTLRCDLCRTCTRRFKPVTLNWISWNVVRVCPKLKLFLGPFFCKQSFGSINQIRLWILQWPMKLWSFPSPAWGLPETSQTQTVYVLYTCMYVCIYVCIYIYILCTYNHSHIYIYIYISIYIYIYMIIYTFMHTHLLTKIRCDKTQYEHVWS